MQHATNTPSHSAVTGLTIAATAVRQDAKGRYCLNDLHRAAGGEKRHQPSDWLRIAQTNELVAEIENSGNSRSKAVAKKEGRGGGTFVVKELVYAYAMWISPKFHLAVIRAYDALVNKVEDTKRLRHSSRVSNKVLNHMLQSARADAGKDTAAHHYINEARAVNFALTGSFTGIDRDMLPLDELDLLAKLEVRDVLLIGKGLDYQQRKADLCQFAADWRAARQPKLGAAA